MPDFATLSCPTCGGKLQITNDIDRFACAHCGNEHIVKRGGGIVALAPVVEGLDGIQRGTDRTAAELTIQRVKGEIQELDREIAELARKALSLDFGGVTRSLQATNLISSSARMSLRPARDTYLCIRLLDDLSVEQAWELVATYKNQAIFKTKKIRATANILRKMCDLKELLERKRDQLEENLRVVEGG